MALKYEEKFSFVEKVCEVYQLLSEIDERFVKINRTVPVSLIQNQIRHYINNACFNDK
ncbi:hypothetical protein GCM10023260_11720 [Bartonella acomydis]|uniref:Uncharacterized protein n=1 Tax=Bartonella acomydis TaxID=686234 RepID=A0ABP9MT39_9HYPH